MPKVFKTRLYIPPHRRGGFVLKTSALGNPYYEEKPVVVSKPTMRGWRYFRDLKRNNSVEEAGDLSCYFT